MSSRDIDAAVDYYAVLGVDHTATEKQIRKAYFEKGLFFGSLILLFCFGSLILLFCFFVTFSNFFFFQLVFFILTRSRTPLLLPSASLKLCKWPTKC